MRADGTLERRFYTYLRPALLALDDFGLKPLPPSGPEDLYDIINERFLARTSERGYLVWTPKAGTQTTPKMPRSDLSAWAFLIVA